MEAFSLKSKNATLAPCLIKERVIDSPIPEPQPVTTTTLLFKEG